MCLAGLDSIDSGQLRVPKARAAVFQEPRLMPWKRAWKNVILGLRVPDAKARAVQALTEVGLAHRLEAYPATLSGGEAQRVALARGLVREPKLLLLDEPFAALDALTRIKMHRLITELWRKHTPAVLLVTHDVDEAILLADRVIVLAEGKIAEQLRIDLPRARDTGQDGFQAIRARLLNLLGVEVDAPAAQPANASVRRTLCLLAAALLMGGCDKAAEAPKSASDLSGVTLILGDQAKGLRTVVEAAHALDGIDYKVQWANFQGAAPLFEALRAGAVDLGPAGDTPVLAAATGGSPLRIVAVRRSQARSIAILVPPDSPIHSVADLKGRNVVVSSARGSISQYLLIRALANAGVDEKDVNVGFVLPTDALPAFNAGKIEAWATFGVYQAFAEQQGARVLISGEGINTGLTFITASDEVLTDPLKRQALRDVLQRFAKAFEWAQQNPEEYARVFATVNDIPLKVSQLLRTWGDESLLPVEERDVQALQQVDDLFVEKKIFPHRVEVRKLTDTEVFSPQSLAGAP
eukprot:gene15444-23607_t